MSNSDDLDLSLDSFDPDSIYSNNIHRRGPSTPNTRLNSGNLAPASSTKTLRQPQDTKDEEERKEPARRPTPAPKPKAKRRGDDEPKEKRENPIIKFFTDERLRIFLGIALILSCVFILYALGSHIKNGLHDQSHVMNSSLTEIAEQGSVNNSGGGAGAWISQLLMCDTLGVGSIFFIIYAWMLAMGLLGFKKVKFWSLTFKILLLSVTTSLVLGLITFSSPSAITWGGNHGYFVNKFLMDHSTWVGAAIVSLLMIAAVACVFLQEIMIAWRKCRDARNRWKLQEELRRQRTQKAKELADLEKSEPAKVEDAPKEQIEVDVPETNNDTEYNIYDLAQTTPSVDQSEQKTKLEDITPDDSEYTNSAFSIENDPASAAEISVATEPKTTEQENADIPQASDTQATVEDKPVELDGGFSIVANEIEMADEIDNRPSSMQPYDHRAELPKFKLPSIDLLEERSSGVVIDMEEQQRNKDKIVQTLLHYNIPISKIEATVGPTVTLYEIVPAEGIRISQIKRLEDDIALSLSALGIRIIAPIPGKGTVGIEVPNNDPQTVSMRSVIASQKYQESKAALPMAMGATISNDIFIADLAKMPHMLVAGATGMGKSVGLNAIIASLLYKKHPSELKFVLIDPKMVEFSLYSKLERHYLAKLPDEDDAIITDPNKVIQTLNSLCIEMDNRYDLLRKANVRALEEYNKKFTERKLNPNDGHRYLPYIVVVVDEFADLIMTAGKEVETPISRIAQKARAVGMHMIIATQRPSTNVITGLIKANFPGRIAFRVIQMVDSRTILDSPGANQLIGRGDMLFSHNGIMERVQCAFISTEEVEAITDSIDNQVGFEHAYYLPEYVPEGADAPIAGASADRDALFDEAARFVVLKQAGSTSMLQRQYNIGYNRAGRLMDQMEAAGIVGPVNGSKPRQILVDSISLERILNQTNI